MNQLEFYRYSEQLSKNLHVQTAWFGSPSVTQLSICWNGSCRCPLEKRPLVTASRLISFEQFYGM